MLFLLLLFQVYQVRNGVGTMKVVMLVGMCTGKQVCSHHLKLPQHLQMIPSDVYVVR